jgi:lipoate-protein ligase A
LHRVRPCVHEVGHRLGLQQIHAAIEDRATREFAGQRRTREGLLHQGSVKLLLDKAFWLAWAQSLAPDITIQDSVSDEVMNRAEKLVQERYGQDEWLHRQRRA